MRRFGTHAWLSSLAYGLVALGGAAGCGKSGSPVPGDGGGGSSNSGGHGGGGGRDAGNGFDVRADGGSAVDVVDAGTGRMQVVYLTFYGWPDNSPPGNAIAYPKSGGFATVHNGAAGAGTYADPITFATDQAELPVGTLLFAPVLEKYLIMEDDCAECDTDWSGSQKWHIDVWMNSNASDDSNAVLDCEDQWTRTTATVEVNPPPGRAATAPPLFDPATNSCRTTP